MNLHPNEAIEIVPELGLWWSPQVLKNFGLTPIPAVGEPYDFNVHEAIQQTPSDEYGEEVVCAEFQRGFMIGDKLLRPAVVAVSMGA